MGSHRVAGAPLDFHALRVELEVAGDFAPEVLAEAERAAAQPQLPDRDDTNIELVTIDPTGSRDLDQAVHIARDGDGYLVSYAIADVAAFVRPGSALDVETHRRGETLYFPDTRVPLHPPSLSEGAASLLPDQVCAAVVWQIQLSATGAVTSVEAHRARVRSRAQLDYEGVQRSVDAGSPPAAVALLPDVGRLRMGLGRERHAINLDLPEQRVEGDDEHGWRLSLRSPLPVESYNAEISLLTGTCAAQLMLDHGYGILRTVPPPDDAATAVVRRAALALGVAWPEHTPPGDVLAVLDRGNPKHVALIEQALPLLRGAGYTAFDGSGPKQRLHAGIGAPYAHVTAPLRRLVDRYGSEICLAVSAGQPIPSWVREAVPQLPEQMQQADQRAHAADRAVVDMTEAWLLRNRIGASFSALVIDADEHAGTVLLDEPAVRARCTGRGLTIGARVTVRLTDADVSKREVRFEQEQPAAAT